MYNLPRLDEQELMLRAKTLYFDRNIEIKEMYVNEFGQFAYLPGNLTEMAKNNGVKVFCLTREACAGITGEVPSLDNFKTKEKKVKVERNVEK